MEDGADDFLVKPVSFEALLKLRGSALQSRLNQLESRREMLAQLRSSVPSQLPHEFFTPLNGIIGLMELLCEEFPSFTPKAVSEMLNMFTNPRCDSIARSQITS